MSSNDIIPAIPSTAGISDPETRRVIDALVTGWETRQGNLLGSESQRFVTYDEMTTHVSDKLTTIVEGTPTVFSNPTGGGSIGSGYNPGGQANYGATPIAIVNSLPAPAGYTGPTIVFLTSDGKLYQLSSGTWTALVGSGSSFAGPVTEAMMADASVSARTIISGAVSYDKLAANTIVASRVVITNLNSVFPDPGFRDPAWWFGNVSQTTWPSNVTITDGTSSDPVARYATISTGASFDWISMNVQGERGGSYRYRLRIYKASGTSGNVYLSVQLPSQLWWAGGAPTTANGGSPVGYYLNLASIPNDTWTSYSDIQPLSSANYMNVRIGAGSFSGTLKFAIEVVRAAGNDLVVDGAITAAKIAANTITASQIAAGSITGDRITAGTVSAAALSVTSLSSITANMGSLTSGNIQLSPPTSTWNYLRSNPSKWWNDGVNGFVTAAYGDGSLFFEARGGSSYIQLGSGTQLGGNVANINFGSGTFTVNISGAVVANNIYARGDIQATSLNASSANIVNTVNIAGNSVTVPVSVQTGADVTLTTFEVSKTVCTTGSIDAAGQPIIINSNFEYRPPYNQITAGDGSNTYTVEQLWFELYRDSTLLRQWKPAQATLALAQPPTDYQTLTLSWIDTPTSGSHTYRLDIRRSRGGGVPNGSNDWGTVRTGCVLWALGCKR